MNMNINTDVTRGRSASSNINNSRESSTHLDTSSVPYHKRMKIQSDNTLWSEQVEIEKRDSFSLSYTISKKGNSDSVKKAADNNTTGRVQGVNNKVTAPNNISSPQGKSETINNTNIYPPQKVINILLLYDIYQLAEHNTWDGDAHFISVYSTIEFLDIDAKNMTISLLQMMNFIKNRNMDQRCINDVPQLNGFGEAAWIFIFSIYESSWDSLFANNKNRTYRQNVSAKIAPKNDVIKPT